MIYGSEGTQALFTDQALKLRVFFAVHLLIL